VGLVLAAIGAAMVLIYKRAEAPKRATQNIHHRQESAGKGQNRTPYPPVAHSPNAIGLKPDTIADAATEAT
jgi:hypothetical protein